MPDHLVLIRSGATEYDLQGRIRGNLDIPLSADGLAEARQVAIALGDAVPQALYTSTTLCAMETSRAIGAVWGLRPRKVSRLENLNLGLWQGKLVEEIRRQQPRLHRQWQEHPWSISPPEGELLEDACDRVEAVVARLQRRHATGRIALVVPEPLEQLVRWIVGGESLGDLWTRDPQRPAWTELPLAAQWKSARRRQKQPL
jgi:broad specificity phosphatase PhoE